MGETNDRLKQARIAAGYQTAREAAKAFGWTESTYLGHENGDRAISKDAAERYAVAFKINPLLLLYEKLPKPTWVMSQVPDMNQLVHMVGWLLHWRGMPEIEADNLAKAIVEYACKLPNPSEGEVSREEARQEARTLARLYAPTVR